MIGLLLAAGLVDAVQDADRRARLHELKNRLGVGPVEPVSDLLSRIDYAIVTYRLGPKQQPVLLGVLRGLIPEYDEIVPVGVSYVYPPKGMRTRYDAMVPWIARELPAMKVALGGQLVGAEAFLREIADWWMGTRADLFRHSWGEALEAADAWHASLRSSEVSVWWRQVRAAQLARVPLVRWADGWSLLELLTAEDLAVEGVALGHCVGTGGYIQGLGKDHHIYSLRDPDFVPRVTIETAFSEQRWAEVIRQARGKGNRVPLGRARAPAVRALRHLAPSVLKTWSGDALAILPDPELLELVLTSPNPAQHVQYWFRKVWYALHLRSLEVMRRAAGSVAESAEDGLIFSVSGGAGGVAALRVGPLPVSAKYLSELGYPEGPPDPKEWFRVRVVAERAMGREEESVEEEYMEPDWADIGPAPSPVSDGFAVRPQWVLPDTEISLFQLLRQIVGRLERVADYTPKTRQWVVRDPNASLLRLVKEIFLGAVAEVGGVSTEDP